MKKVLAFSSEYAGHGHKSLCASLRQAFEASGEDVEFVEINGFTFGGKPTLMLEKAYIPTVTYTRAAWAVTYKMVSDFSSLTNNITEVAMKRRFLKLIEEEKPDLLVSVHASFIESVQQILQSNGIFIPMVTIVADLDNISRLWYSEKCGVYMCPSEESLNSLKEFGLRPEQKAYVSGLPVRKMFRELRGQAGKSSHDPKNVKILILCTTEKLFRIRDFLEEYLPGNTNTITMITGRNPNLFFDLRRMIPDRGWQERVSVVEYCPNFYELLARHDLFIGKGGPNAIMECANIGIPMISIGTLPGQEAKNEDFILKNNLGRACRGLKNASSVINEMLADNGAVLDSIRASQLEFTKFDAAEFIINKCLDIMQ